MKNITQKKNLFWVSLIVIYTTTLSAMPTMWPNWDGFNDDIKQYSTMFKFLQGSNRLNEFDHLKNILDAAATYGYSKEDLIKVLGTPQKASPKQMQYCLQDAANTTTLTININEITKQVIGYAVSIN